MPWTLVVILIIFVPLAGMHYYVRRKVFAALCDLTTWNKTVLQYVTAGFHLWALSLPLAYMIWYVVAGRKANTAFGGESVVVDLLLSYPFWFALVIVGQLFLLFALLDLLDISILKIVPVTRAWVQHQRSRISIGLLVIVTLYSLVTIAIDTWTVKIADYTIPISQQFGDLDGFRIALISDVQGDGRTTANDLRRYVARVNSLRPDVVLFGGDLVTWGTGYIDSTAEILGQLRSRLGTIAAVGDHDMFSNKTMVKAALSRNGIRIVEDSTISVAPGGPKVAFSVVTYTYMQKPSRDRLESMVRGTDGSYKVFLVHQPAEELVHFAEQHGYDLFLAGHTHGGGLAIGIPGLFLLAPANLETKYVRGLYKTGRMAVCVTNGLGLTLTPIRFNAPAEIAMITLRKEQ
jgi:uncharacterized protein